MWSEKLPSGKVRFVERYADPLTGKQKKLSVTMDRDTASTRKQAQAALNDKISAQVENLLAPSKTGDLRLSELVELYRANQKTSVTQSTYQRNYFAENTFMTLLGESTIVSRLTAVYVKEKFMSGDVTPGKFNERIKRFKAMIRWGYENDYISDIRYLDKISPLADKERREKLQEKYLESAELKTLLDVMKIKKWRCLAELTALSGMRCGEAIALNMDDIDFKNKTITVTKTFDPVNKIVTPPKTSKSNREIYMQPELERLCHAIRRATLAGKLKYGHQSELFMCDINGEHLDYYAYNKYLGEVSMRVLNRKITTHIMRHTHVSLMAEAGVPLEVITRRVGHENSDITRRIYLHITERQKEKDREQIKDIKIL